MKFKKGAFFAEKTVRPTFLKYNYSQLSPAFDVMEFLPLIILTLSWNLFTCTVHSMPDFHPNEYLFETHSDKGDSRWEIYAWAVRDAMCKAGGFKECDDTYKQKEMYENYMQCKPGSPFPIKSPNPVTSELREAIIDSENEPPAQVSNNNEIELESMA